MVELYSPGAEATDSIFSSAITPLGKAEWGIVSLGLAVMDNGNFVKCLSVLKSLMRELYFIVLGQGD